MQTLFIRLIQKIQTFVNKPWYVPLIMLLAAMDSFLFIFPIDLFLITRILFQKEFWIQTALSIATASALGSLCLALFIKLDLPFLLKFMDRLEIHSAQHFTQGTYYIHQYGAIGVGIVSLSFIPLPIAIVVAAWEKVPLLSIFFAAWIGRCIKYLIYGFISAYFPGFLRKIKRH